MKLLSLIFNLTYDISLIIMFLFACNGDCNASKSCLTKVTIQVLFLWVILIPCFVFNLLTILAGQKMKFKYACFDEYTNEKNKEIMSDINLDLAQRIASLVINVILLVGIIVILIIGIRKGYEQMEERSREYHKRLDEEGKQIEVQDVNQN